MWKSDLKKEMQTAGFRSRSKIKAAAEDTAEQGLWPLLQW